MLGGASDQDKSRATGGANLADTRRVAQVYAPVCAPMAKPDRSGGLDIAEDMEFQRRSWKVQRVGWGVIGLIVAAAIAGWFGTGPLANAHVQSAVFEIEYERFVRRHRATELTVRALAPAGSGALRLVIDNHYLERAQISDIVPPPLRKEGGRQSTAFVFESRPAVPDRIVFRVKPEHAGPLEARIALDGGDTLAFHQFVFP